MAVTAPDSVTGSSGTPGRKSAPGVSSSDKKAPGSTRERTWEWAKTTPSTPRSTARGTSAEPVAALARTAAVERAAVDAIKEAVEEAVEVKVDPKQFLEDFDWQMYEEGI